MKLSAALVARLATRNPALLSLLLGLSLSMVIASQVVNAHGAVTPQAINTDGLPQLKGALIENPYRSDNSAYKKAIEIGASAYSENCARCHGLGAVSGGIAPDLRKLPPGKEGDEFYQERVRHGSIRNGITYMPPFTGIFNEEAIWAIRSWLDSVYVQE